MTSDEYWYGDCNLVKTYRELYKMKRDSRNYEMWLQGLYIHEGFAIVLNNAFGKKGSKKHKYPDKPYEIYQDKKSKPQNVQVAREDAVNQLNNLMSKWSKNNGK